MGVSAFPFLPLFLLAEVSSLSSLGRAASISLTEDGSETSMPQGTSGGRFAARDKGHPPGPPYAKDAGNQIQIDFWPICVGPVLKEGPERSPPIPLGPLTDLKVGWVFWC